MKLRHTTTHDALACWSGVDRPPYHSGHRRSAALARERGCTAGPGVRLRPLAGSSTTSVPTGRPGSSDRILCW
ncbi:hypothetical protein [Streptomyces griseoluteus]|uniref:hypothetical protein n=1 Tax=Streptomyces griseoluteus TaxID=29306 RepID=UPI003F4D624F